jgi:hypothetical protein
VILLAEDATRLLRVVKVTVIDLSGPAAWLPTSDIPTTAPTDGVLTRAAIESEEVLISKPVVPPTVAVTAAIAASASPVHVTVTDPAARAEVTVNVILLVSYAEVETTEAGEVMPHKLMACAVTRPAGKDSVILLSDACAVNGVEVLKVTAADPPAPTALLI